MLAKPTSGAPRRCEYIDMADTGTCATHIPQQENVSMGHNHQCACNYQQTILPSGLRIWGSNTIPTRNTPLRWGDAHMHNGGGALQRLQLFSHGQEELVVQLLLLFNVAPQLLGRVTGGQQPLRQRYACLGILQNPHMTASSGGKSRQVLCPISLGGFLPGESCAF
jgi:hypothetical protein